MTVEKKGKKFSIILLKKHYSDTL